MLVGFPTEIIFIIAEYTGPRGHRILSQTCRHLRFLLLDSTSYEVRVHSQWRLPGTIPEHVLKQLHYLTIDVVDDKDFAEASDSDNCYSDFGSQEAVIAMQQGTMERIRSLRLSRKTGCTRYGERPEGMFEFGQAVPVMRIKNKVLLPRITPNLRFLEYYYYQSDDDDIMASIHHSAKIIFPNCRELHLFQHLRDLRLFLHYDEEMIGALLDGVFQLPLLDSLYLQGLSIDDTNSVKLPQPRSSRIKILQIENSFVVWDLWSIFLEAFEKLEGFSYESCSKDDTWPWDILKVLTALILHHKDTIVALGLHSRIIQNYYSGGTTQWANLRELVNLRCLSCGRQEMGELRDADVSDPDRQKNFNNSIAEIMPKSLRVLNYAGKADFDLTEFIESSDIKLEKLQVFEASEWLIRVAQQKSIDLVIPQDDVPTIYLEFGPWMIQDDTGTIRFVFR